jgi:hypothetical protein
MDQATYDAMQEHMQQHGCTLPATLMVGINPLDAPPPEPGQHAPGYIPTFGYGNWPMNQPSNRQNRTTEIPFKNHRQRHPSNPNKLMSIWKWQELYPDVWPDGNAR